MTDWIKKALTKKKATNKIDASVADEVPPSERLVLGVKFAITLTFSLTAIEIAHLALLPKCTYSGKNLTTDKLAQNIAPLI